MDAVISVDELNALGIVPWKGLGWRQTHRGSVFICEGDGAMIGAEQLPSLVRESFIWSVVKTAMIVLHYRIIDGSSYRNVSMISVWDRKANAFVLAYQMVICPGLSQCSWCLLARIGRPSPF